MKESSEKAMEVNNELRVNVDKLQDDKKMCVTCNKRLALQIGCKKDIKDNQTEFCSHYCGKTFGNKKELDNHI